MRLIVSVLTVALFGVVVACGDDSSSDSGTGDSGTGDSGTGDSGTGDSGTDAAFDTALDTALDDVGADAQAHCVGSQLLIAEVVPMESITILNPGTEDVDLTGTGWVLCQRPNYVQLEMIESGVVIPAGGSRVYPMPGAFVDQGNAAGELALYRTSAFTNPDAQIDYVCWGDGRSENRRDVAQSAGTWSGPCVAPLAGPLRRRPNTDGVSAESYDSSGATPALSCP